MAIYCHDIRGKADTSTADSQQTKLNVHKSLLDLILAWHLWSCTTFSKDVSRSAISTKPVKTETQLNVFSAAVWMCVSFTVADAFLTVETCTTVKDARPVFQQGGWVWARHALLLTRPTALRARLVTVWKIRKQKIDSFLSVLKHHEVWFLARFLKRNTQYSTVGGTRSKWINVTVTDNLNHAKCRRNNLNYANPASTVCKSSAIYCMRFVVNSINNSETLILYNNSFISIMQFVH